MKTLLVRIAYGFAALLLFKLLSVLATFVAAPVGGGEYHLIFAYSDSGRLGTALYIYAVLVGTLAAVSVALIWLSYRLGWVPLCILASAVGLHHWWGIATWERTSPEFRAAAWGLFLSIPLWIGLAAWLAAGRPTLTAPRAREGVGVTHRRSRRLRAVAWLALAAPVLAFAVFPLSALAEGTMRRRWVPDAWERPRREIPAPILNPARGIVFAGEKARSLLAQCTRPTPGWVVGTWTPTDSQIAVLEQDLARFLVQNDTGRTRANGFRMPSLTTYYRQYGGVRLMNGRQIIYVNGILQGAFTDTGPDLPAATWREEAVIVCDGWQAYFGVEYDPIGRRFRGFAYN